MSDINWGRRGREKKGRSPANKKFLLRNGIEILIYYRFNGKTWAGSYVIPDKISPHKEGKWGEVYSKERRKIPGLLRAEIARFLNPKIREIDEKFGNFFD